MKDAKTELATFAGGCFWCIEAVFDQIPGVVRADSGYTGGNVPHPTYDQVCEGTTGHAEAVEIEFDPAKVTYDQLLELFWEAHDPTQLNRQGNDVGTQYRSAVFYHDEAQRMAVEASIGKLGASGRYPGKIVTQVVPATTFYRAEAYHQAYYINNRSQGYCRFIIRPKLEKLGLQP
jgi:peptide-methionine (S)-S-oxide reductase